MAKTLYRDDDASFWALLAGESSAATHRIERLRARAQKRRECARGCKWLNLSERFIDVAMLRYFTIPKIFA